MEFPFGGRCFDLTHRAVVIGEVGSAPNDQRTDEFVDRATALADVEADGLYVDPTGWTRGSRTPSSIQDLLHTIEHLKMPILLRVTSSADIDVARTGDIAGLDLTACPGHLRPDVVLDPPGPVVVTGIDGGNRAGARVGSSVVDIGPLDGPDLPGLLRRVPEFTDRGHVVCCRMPGTPDPSSSSWGALALALRRGVRLVITHDVTSTRRTSHVMERIAESGTAL